MVGCPCRQFLPVSNRDRTAVCYALAARKRPGGHYTSIYSINRDVLPQPRRAPVAKKPRLLLNRHNLLAHTRFQLRDGNQRRSPRSRLCKFFRVVARKTASSNPPPPGHVWILRPLPRPAWVRLSLRSVGGSGVSISSRLIPASLRVRAPAAAAPNRGRDPRRPQPKEALQRDADCPCAPCASNSGIPDPFEPRPCQPSPMPARLRCLMPPVAQVRARPPATTSRQSRTDLLGLRSPSVPTAGDATSSVMHSLHPPTQQFYGRLWTRMRIGK